MTAFTPANLPASIDTLEKLCVWANNALYACNPTLSVIEGVGYTERAAQTNPYFVPADNKIRLVMRQSIQLSPDYLAGGAKLWTYAQILSSTAIPALYLP